MMHGEFKMSMIGKLNYFLGLEIKQTMAYSSINQNIAKKILKIFDMDNCKVIDTPTSSSTYVDQ